MLKYAKKGKRLKKNAQYSDKFAPENFADASRQAVLDMIDDIAGALGTK